MWKFRLLKLGKELLISISYRHVYCLIMGTLVTGKTWFIKTVFMVFFLIWDPLTSCKCCPVRATSSGFFWTRSNLCFSINSYERPFISSLLVYKPSYFL